MNCVDLKSEFAVFLVGKRLKFSVFDKKFTLRDGLRCWLFQISVLSASDLFLPEQTGGWAGQRGRSGIQNHKHTAKAANTLEIHWKYTGNTVKKQRNTKPQKHFQNHLLGAKK